jgi:hypothetical protein
MKRALTICLSVIYLAMASGVVVNVHYCMGKVASVAIGHAETDRCGDCGMDNTGCCKDEVIVVKVDDTHALAPSMALPAVASAALADQPQSLRLPMAGRETALPSFAVGYPPGGRDGRSICIRNSVFRI